MAESESAMYRLRQWFSFLSWWALELATQIFAHFVDFGDATVDYIASFVSIFDAIEFGDDDVYFCRPPGKKTIFFNWCRYNFYFVIFSGKLWFHVVPLCLQHTMIIIKLQIFGARLYIYIYMQKSFRKGQFRLPSPPYNRALYMQLTKIKQTKKLQKLYFF